MLDFRKQFQEIIEQSYIPFNIDKTATSDVWSNIYKLVLPNIPEKLFRYRRIDDKGYTIESFKSKTISLCHAGMFPDKYDSYLYIDQDKIHKDLKNALKDALRITLSHITQKSPEIRTEKATKICYYREYNSLGMNVNLFPVIYTDLRPDVTLDEGNIHTYEYFKQVGDKNWLNFLSSMISVNQLYWYRAYLYKDRKEYEHEHEWRMLYYNLEDENDYVAIPDVGCLKAIYYGPDISQKDKQELHRIAVEKGLKEYDVDLDAGSRRYDLRVTVIK